MPTRTREVDAAAPDRAGDAGVERLARRLGEVVENVPENERQELREYAIELLRDEAETARQQETARIAETPARSTGIFGFAVLLALAGAALILVFPPVEIVLLFLAVPLAGWGAVQTALGRVKVGKRLDRRAPPAAPDDPAHRRT